MSKTNANRLIDAAETVQNLAPFGVTPTHERQVRPLASLEPEQQRAVWAEWILALRTTLVAKRVFEPRALLKFCDGRDAICEVDPELQSLPD